MNAQAPRWGATVAIVALVAWAGLASAQGGIDVGERTGTGPTALMLAVIGAVVGAGVVVWSTRDLAVWRSGPLRLAVLGLGGLAVWSGLSASWAPQPHLSWIEANQAALYLSVLLIAVGVGARLAPNGVQIGGALALAVAIPVVFALAVEVLPGLLGDDLDPGRLAKPAGYHNALGLFAAVGIIGLACLRPRNRLTSAGLAAGATLFVTALGLTLSRGAVLALIVALVALVVIGGTRRIPAIEILCGGVAAVLPLSYGLSQSVLTDERVAVALREEAALMLGLSLCAAALLAALASALLRGRLPGGGAAAVLIMAVLALSAGVAGQAQAGPGGAPGASAIDNSPDRALSLSSNNRDAWWGEAMRGWRSAPVVGNGAGSFRMVHLRERRDDSSLFIVRQPHQLALKMLSDLGVVGLTLLLMWVIGVGWAVVRARRSGVAASVAPAVAVIVAFLVQAQLDWTFSIPAVGALAAGATGLVLARGATGGSTTARGSDGLLAATTALVVCAVVASALLPWLSLREVDAAETASANGDLASALRHTERAAALNPLSPRPLEEEAFAHFTAGDVAAAAAARRDLTQQQPENPFAWAGLAVLLRGDAAQQAWLRVRQLDPMSPAARRALIDED